MLGWAERGTESLLWRQVSRQRRHNSLQSTPRNSRIPRLPSHTYASRHFTSAYRDPGAMVVPLGPGKFYGSALPRPWIYTDVKLNDERVDPPLPVMDALISWANEAHWSMGGLSFKRHRLQGRIEGNVNKLRVQLEKELFKKSEKQKSIKGSSYGKRSSSETPSPPPAPVAIKRRRVVGLVDEEEVHTVTKRGPVRKLGDDFERVARESGMPAKVADNSGDRSGVVAGRTRSKRNGADVVVDEGKIKKGKKKLIKGGRRVAAAVVAAAAGLRSSPRLSKKSG